MSSNFMCEWCILLGNKEIWVKSKWKLIIFRNGTQNITLQRRRSFQKYTEHTLHRNKTLTEKISIYRSMVKSLFLTLKCFSVCSNPISISFEKSITKDILLEKQFAITFYFGVKIAWKSHALKKLTQDRKSVV